MKELDPPHNDWWSSDRPLPFGRRRPNIELSMLMQDLVNPTILAKAVKSGMRTLEQNPQHIAFKQKLTLQEQLRPLFCPVELNISSDLLPNEVNSPLITIPSAFFVDPFFLPRQ